MRVILAFLLLAPATLRAEQAADTAATQEFEGSVAEARAAAMKYTSYFGADWTIIQGDDSVKASHKTVKTDVGFSFKKGSEGHVTVTADCRVPMGSVETLTNCSKSYLQAIGNMMQAYRFGPPQQATARTAETSKPRSDVDEPLKALRPQGEDDFAVIVGVEDYQNVPKAEHAENDARAMKRAFVALGVPEENVVLLTGAKATRTGLAKYLEEWLPRNVTEKSRVYFYYSGHGAPDSEDGSSYLVPWDGDPAFLKTSAYPLPRVYEKLAALKAARVVAMIDSCFSGAGGRSVIAKGTRPLVSVKAAAPPASSKLAVFSAAAADETTGALDDQGHGLFTYYLLKGLRGAAAVDGHVTLGGLGDYVKKAVSKGARRQNREQSPQLSAADPAARLY